MQKKPILGIVIVGVVLVLLVGVMRNKRAQTPQPEGTVPPPVAGTQTTPPPASGVTPPPAGTGSAQPTPPPPQGTVTGANAAQLEALKKLEADFTKEVDLFGGATDDTSAFADVENSQ